MLSQILLPRQAAHLKSQKYIENYRNMISENDNK